MQINDRVYGTVTVKEPVLIMLINSKPLQRLKGINQAGASQYVVAGTTVSRYEHSVGVMILLKRLGATLEEQIAGLLHDVPHTAFSHVIDFVFKSDNHEFHERFHEKLIKNSEIPSIIAEFGFNLERILDERNFPLLERSLPDLCADRIDYTLRDMTAIYGANKNISEYASGFRVVNNEIVMKDKDVARRFAEDYLDADEALWSHPREISMFQILADAIRIALDRKILSEDDLFRDDAFVYDKLKQSKNEEILKKLAFLNPKLEIAENPDDYHFYAKTKLRYINPKFFNGGGTISRVSEACPEFETRLAEHRKRIEKGNFVKVVSW